MTLRHLTHFYVLQFSLVCLWSEISNKYSWFWNVNIRIQIGYQYEVWCFCIYHIIQLFLTYISFSILKGNNILLFTRRQFVLNIVHVILYNRHKKQHIYNVSVHNKRMRIAKSYVIHYKSFLWVYICGYDRLSDVIASFILRVKYACFNDT